MVMDGTQSDEGDRPQRPPNRVREPSPIDAQRQPAMLTRALNVWRAASLAGLLALVTAALWRDERRAELIAAVGTDVSPGDREQTVTVLVIATFVVLVVLLAAAGGLSARLARGGALTRGALTVVVVLQVVAAPFAIQILTATQWEGRVTTGLFALQVLLGAVGAVLMWLPAAHRR